MRWAGSVLLACVVTGVAVLRVPEAAPAPPVRVYLTTADLTRALSPQPNVTLAPLATPIRPLIQVDESRRYQRIDGFGGAMTDTSAWLLYTAVPPARRAVVLRRLFDPTRGIGISFLRVPMAASDFTKDGRPYSYDDLPPGRSDPEMVHFSIRHDLAYMAHTASRRPRRSQATAASAPGARAGSATGSAASTT